MRNKIETIGVFSGGMLRLLEQCDEEFLSLHKPDFHTVGQYKEEVQSAIRKIHNGDLWRDLISKCLPECLKPDSYRASCIDCCHIEYPSLVLRAYSQNVDECKVVRNREIHESMYLREFFDLFETEEKHLKSNLRPIGKLIKEYVKTLHSYEIGYEILPRVQGDICSIGFFPDETIKDLRCHLEKGIYIFDKNAISSLIEMLSCIPQFRPYAVSPPA